MTTKLAHGAAARRALAMAAALATAPLASPAQAQPADTGSTGRARAAAVPLPPPPHGTTLRRREEASLSVAVGPFAAFDRGESVALHFDYGVPRTPAGWQRARLEWRLAVMLARPAEETDLTRTVTPPFGTPVTISAGGEELRAWVVEVVPTARIRLPLAGGFALHADAGLGLAQTVERYDRREMFVGRTEETRNVTGPVLRLGAGMSLDVSPRLAVLFAPVALSLHLGSDFSSFTPYLGLAWRP